MAPRARRAESKEAGGLLQHPGEESKYGSEERLFENRRRSQPRRGERHFEPPRPEHNNPATLEEFDREHMGVAAKE